MRARTSVLTLVAVLSGTSALPAQVAASGSETSGHEEHAAAASTVETARPRYAVTSERYDVPDVTLVDAAGRSVSLRTLLDVPGPVALNFIFTTCTTICPVMTATFAQMRRELGDAGAELRMVSISIDPDYDRPAVLKAYAAKFKAGTEWTFLTGDGRDVERVLRAFGAYAGSKMNHRPLTLLKSASEPSWFRIDGLASGGDLAHEVHARLLH